MSCVLESPGNGVVLKEMMFVQGSKWHIPVVTGRGMQLNLIPIIFNVTSQSKETKKVLGSFLLLVS